ncbi:prenyltransferase, UbiA family protein [Streptomyces viridochromogenes]|uniref:Prenyltransferase, UbiA family protein n=1 Tax=Streptomyces viridochromogenes TaxID=1938 RepID=A0A0J7ZLH8_STRVR|nr:UbiA family prenyltransferase [Streptomyces viridochromogenes]KMS76886.1 prenyltransferase, UbiA family protein [Streptomyces viridochromogenes]KOG22049.1 prenyltransferase, UbiA family protein [Streptomyces viridochromogenes]KOG29956.1 prenyltransferase, UbiA family protein [Streptomyces viridochromogenes]
MKDRKAVVRFGSRSAVRLSDLALLVRAPAALSVPGDVIAGAAAAGRPLDARTFGVIGSSVCLYWAGMALNDYADATVDSVERPDRPVPSGRVPRRTALGVAGALTVAGIGLAAAAGGRRSVGVALPLAGLIWAYDLKLKSTPAGGFAMAGARVLDVLAGAVVPGAGAESVGVAVRRAAVPAGLVGVHTGTLMALSRHEIGGAPVRVPGVTLAVSAATALATAVPVEQDASGGAAKGHRAAAAPWWLVAPRGGAAVRHSPAPLKGVAGTVPSKRFRTALTAAGALAYLGAYGSAQVRAVRKPSGENVRRAVGAGILGLMPLQAALTARGGAPGVAAALGVVHPLARRLARRISPT